MCLWLPRWPLERLAAARPELKRRELVLYAPDRRGLLRVAACSGRHGITLGMPVAEASALADVYLESHDPLADRAALVQLAGWCERFSPLVGIFEPDNLLLDVTGLAPLFGGEELLVEQVACAFGRFGLTAHIAVADTIGAAWASAHFAKENPTILGGRDLAGIECGVAGVERSESPANSRTAGGSAASTPATRQLRTIAVLAGLPIDALRLADSTIEILAELGIQTIGQLMKLSRDAIASRFDSQLLCRLDQALGVAPETIQSHRPPPEFFSQARLEFALTGQAELEHVLAGLLEQTCGQLAQHQQGAIQLALDLDCETGPPVHFVVGLYRASASARHLLELARLQLDRLMLPGPVIGAKVSVLSSAPLTSWQQELFEKKSQTENERQLAAVVDRLANRLGREAVVRAVPLAEAQPELAFHYQPLAGISPRPLGEGPGVRLQGRRRQSSVRKKQVGTLTLSQRERGHKPRPLRLEREPIPLEVLSVVPQGPPIRFCWHGRQEQVARAWGPERIETGWWRGRYVQRDYYRVETTTGARFWLFRGLADENWFLHGIFE